MPFVKQDNNLIWEPNPRQADFISLPDTIFEALFGGQAGPGKTEVLLMLPVIRQFHQNPNFHCGVIRTTFRKLDEEIIPRSQKIYPHFSGVYNETKKRWNFPSGARIQFIYLEDRKHAEDHDTTEFNLLCYDELTEQGDEWIYNFMTSRVRTLVGADIPGIVRAGTNPGKEGHSWVKRRFGIDKCPKGGKLIYHEKSDTYRIFIEAKLEDNIHMEKGYHRRLSLLPEAERKAKQEGNWDIFAGQVFGELRTERIQDEPDNALHVVDSFPIPEYYPHIAAIDVGKQAMTCFQVGAVSPNGRVLIHTQYGKRGQEVIDWTTAFIDSIRGINLKVVLLDPATKRVGVGQRESVLDQFTKFCMDAYSGKVPFEIRLANNNRIAGKNNVHEHLRWKQITTIPVDIRDYSEEMALSILRNKGSEAHQEYLNQFQERPPETNLPKMLIFKDSVYLVDKDKENYCLDLVESLQACVYNNDKGNPEDVKEFEGDDPYDTIKYLLSGVSDLIRASSVGELASNEVEEAIAYLRKTNDRTGFTRKMEVLEAKKKKSSQSIKLHPSRMSVVQAEIRRSGSLTQAVRRKSRW